MNQVFVSYSHKDSDYAHKLARALEEAGFEVWIDGRIDYGSEWPRVIQEHLDRCAALIVVMTPRAYESGWVQNELNRAKRKNKPIFPLLLEGDEPWLSVESIQYVDVRDGKLPPPRFFARLGQIAPVRDASGDDTPPPPAPSKPFTPPDLRQILPPPFVWCEIPAGRVKVEYGSSQPVPGATCKVHMVERFFMAKYPVTNGQYQAFVDDPQGYANRHWWGYSDAAREWRDANPLPEEPACPEADHPRVNVCWYEAVAFCRWLNDRLESAFTPIDPSGKPAYSGGVISLPTEQQWQRAAQGDFDTAEYPWNGKFSAWRCNTLEGGIITTSSVTRFAVDGASPFGVLDMSGNVWEWCLNEWAGDGSSISGSQPRVLRGGSWLNDHYEARVVSRFWNFPYVRFNFMGFRVIVAPIR